MALSAHEQVRKTLDELRVHISRITNRPIDPDVDNATTLIETLTAAYMLPSAGTDWNAQGLRFTVNERRIMDLLATQRGRIFSRDAIMNALYFDRMDQPAVKIVDVFVCHLRTKLFKSKSNQWIENAWGDGYRLIYKPAVEGDKELRCRPKTRAGKFNAVVG